MKKIFFMFVVGIMVLSISLGASSAARKPSKIGINVLLNTKITDAILTDLAKYGSIRDVVYQINAVTLQTVETQLPKIKGLPYVLSASPDATRKGAPVDTVEVTDFLNGLSTWDQDAINVTDFGFNNRQVDFDGTGVYVAVLDTGLLDSWRQYFPQERIATQYAKAFGGGGGENGNVSEPTNKWEHDQNSHGTHVTSTILGYSLRRNPGQRRSSDGDGDSG